MTVSSSRSSSRKTSTRRKKAARPVRDLAQEVTDKIVAALEAGVVPWRPQIRPAAGTAAPAGLPRNLSTGKTYRGCNVFLLWVAQVAYGWSRSDWLTYKQAEALGAQVRRGEKGATIVFYNVVEREDPKAPDGVRRHAFLKAFTVFNADQVDGLEEAPAAPAPEPVDAAATPQRVACEEIVQHYGRGSGSPRLLELDVTPHYNPHSDTVVVPPMGGFENPEAYFATLFHEYAHSTGHPTRLARPGIVASGAGGIQAYGAEEMVAELASALLCAHAGIAPETEEMAAAYIGGWLKTLREEKGFFLAAAGQAQKAADRIRPPAEEAPDAAG